jgi:hypothetical protein
MKKFERTKLNLGSAKDEIKRIQGMGKSLGLKNYTRKDAKEEYRRILEDEIYTNDQYQVNVARKHVPHQDFWIETANVRVVHLSIKRLDREAIHDWRDLQEIKNELFGKDYVALEIYPAEDDLRDSANQYHLWVFTDNVDGDAVPFPLGWQGRVVSEVEDFGVKQRKFTVGA